jgi:hypothetical protein
MAPCYAGSVLTGKRTAGEILTHRSVEEIPRQQRHVLGRSRRPGPRIPGAVVQPTILVIAAYTI